MTIIRQNYWMAASVFVFGLMFFIFTSAQMEVISFESRFYLFALEMWRHGPSWFSTTYHEPYPDYPGTGTFFIYVFSKIMGGLTRFTAVFPSAFISAMTLTVTYLIGAHHSQKWGLSAVCFLLLTYAFVAEARTISLDQYTTFITALCFYLAMRKKIAWIFPLMVLGFAIRGPIGLVVPTGVLCVFYLMDKDIKKLFIVCSVSTLLFVLCGVILLALAYQEGGESFVQEVIKMQVVGRLQEARRLPWEFYFVQSFAVYAIVYPIAILMSLGILRIKTPDRIFLLKLLGWAFIILLGLSIPTNKKIRYILPMAPALALLCGYLFAVRHENKYYYLLQKIVYSFFIYFPTLSLIALQIIRLRYPEFVLNYIAISCFFVIAQVVLFIIHYKIYHKEITTLIMTSIIFMSTYIWIVEPVNLQLNKTHAFVQNIEMMRQDASARLAFYHEGKDGLVIKYMANMTKDEQPLFVLNANELLTFKQAIFFIATNDNFAKIPFDFRNHLKIVSYGKIGREPFLVFTNK